VNDEASRVGVVASVAAAVNPEVTVSTPHPYIKTCGRGNKFGIAYDEIPGVARRSAWPTSIRLRGTGHASGSQIAGTDPYRTACVGSSRSITPSWLMGPRSSNSWTWARALGDIW